MNTNLNNIFFTIVIRPNSVDILENEFHLRGYSGNYSKKMEIRGYSGKIFKKNGDKWFFFVLIQDSECTVVISVTAR